MPMPGIILTLASMKITAKQILNDVLPQISPSMSKQWNSKQVYQ